MVLGLDNEPAAPEETVQFVERYLGVSFKEFAAQEGNEIVNHLRPRLTLYEGSVPEIFTTDHHSHSNES